jgi:hypothetical protein
MGQVFDILDPKTFEGELQTPIRIMLKVSILLLYELFFLYLY